LLRLAGETERDVLLLHKDFITAGLRPEIDFATSLVVAIFQRGSGLNCVMPFSVSEDDATLRLRYYGDQTSQSTGPDSAGGRFTAYGFIVLPKCAKAIVVAVITLRADGLSVELQANTLGALVASVGRPVLSDEQEPTYSAGFFSFDDCAASSCEAIA
jgi:hypothetical protein